MLQLHEIPTHVTVPVRVNEDVQVFWRRVLMVAARLTGLPLLEQGWFADALIAQRPEAQNLTWKNGNDPTPPRAPRWDDNRVKTTDFNHLLLRHYLNANPGAGRKIVPVEKLRPYEGRSTITQEIGPIVTAELTLWRQDFIYRGGEIGIGIEAPISRSGLVPALQQPSATPDITHIPAIMRSKGWNEGSALMEAWFSRAAKERTSSLETTQNDYGPPVYGVIKMAWILTFARARTQYDKLVNEQLWKNDNAKRVIFERFGPQLPVKGTVLNLPSLYTVGLAANHHRYIQSIEVSQSLYDAKNNPDGLTAALANFRFYMTFAGSLTRTDYGIEVKMSEIGIYVRDSYDFINDKFIWECLCYDQKLGEWPGVGMVTNDSFNNWRKANNKGGDFFVYSDITINPLNPAQNTFTIPMP